MRSTELLGANRSRTLCAVLYIRGGLRRIASAALRFEREGELPRPSSSTNAAMRTCDKGLTMGILEESRTYFEEIALPSLRERFPESMDRLAVGLVGNGSECYGYDDEQSLDHDCGIDFGIWIVAEGQSERAALYRWKQDLFKSNPPRILITASTFGSARNPQGAGDFYRDLIGVADVPLHLKQWLAVPEENLSLATNGAVFYDGCGEFTRVREGLLKYVPEDLRRKRIAAWCMQAAQAGQYNLERMWRRDDIVAVQFCKSRFAEAVIALVFALNRVYRPYYKWAHRMMRSLEVLGPLLADELCEYMGMDMLSARSLKRHLNLTETMCARIADQLRAQGLSDTRDTFLVAHGLQVQSSIDDVRLAKLPAQTLV